MKNNQSTNLSTVQSCVELISSVWMSPCLILCIFTTKTKTFPAVHIEISFFHDSVPLGAIFATKSSENYEAQRSIWFLKGVTKVTHM